MPKQTSLIRKVYLYLVTAITIVILLIGFIGLLNLLLKEYVLDVKGWQETEPYWECDQYNEMYLKGDITIERDVSVPVVVEEGEVAEAPAGMTDEELEKCKADAKENREIQRVNDLKRELAQNLAMILVALPIYLYHWGVIKKENE